MSKRVLKGYILIFLVFVLYVTLTVFFPKTAIFWIAATFTVPAFFAQLFTLHRIDREDSLIKDRALDFPKLRISALYLIVQLAVSMLLMAFAAKIHVLAAAAIEVAVLLSAVAGFYAVEAACAEIVRQNAQTRERTKNMQALKERLNLLLAHCDQEQIQAGLRGLADEMKYCNPSSTDGSLEIESEIAALFLELEETALSGESDTAVSLCDRITGLFRERDKICKCKG